MRRPSALPLLLLCAGMAGAQAPGASGPRPRTQPAPWGREAPGRDVVGVRFLPITGAPFSRPGTMKHPVGDEDLVIGIARRGEARAYPIRMLGGPEREVVNDRIGDEPLIVNW